MSAETAPPFLGEMPAARRGPTIRPGRGAGAADAGGSIGGFAATLIFALPVAYAVGLPAALLVGLAVAWADRRRPGISWRTALAAGAAVGVVMAGLATLVVPAQGLAVWSATLLVASSVAALAGWAVARHLFTGRPRRAILWTGGHALLHAPATGEIRDALFPPGSAAGLDP